MNLITKNNLLPADRIVVPKSKFRLIQHHAIYLGEDAMGNNIIAENKIGVGVRAVVAEDFFKDSIGISRIERFQGNAQQRENAVEVAIKQLGKPYNLIGYNCESFSNQVQYNNLNSRQVINAILLLVVALYIYILISTK